jgi:hypothetical protein
MTSLTLGPIIGKVTETSARILVEYPADTHVTMKLIKSGSKSHPTVEKLCSANVPTVFHFDELDLNTIYKVETADGSI